MILSIFRNLRAKIIGAKVGHFVSLDRRGNLVDSGYGYQDLASPLPSGGTNGQVLTKGTGDNVSWADAPKELPTYSSSDTGKVLTVDVVGGLMWDNIPRELPLYSSADADKYLRVTSGGGLQWAAGGGGSFVRYRHNVVLTKTDSSNKVIGVAHLMFYTDYHYDTNITTMSDLDAALGSFVGNQEWAITGEYTFNNTTYHLDILKFENDLFNVYYYFVSSNGLLATLAFALDGTDSHLSFTDSVTTL